MKDSPVDKRCKGKGIHKMETNDSFMNNPYLGPYYYCCLYPYHLRTHFAAMSFTSYLLA